MVHNFGNYHGPLSRHAVSKANSAAKELIITNINKNGRKPSRGIHLPLYTLFMNCFFVKDADQC